MATTTTTTPPTNEERINFAKSRIKLAIYHQALFTKSKPCPEDAHRLCRYILYGEGVGVQFSDYAVQLMKEVIEDERERLAQWDIFRNTEIYTGLLKSVIDKLD
uniref:Uncharacterized protein n=1 Tax=Clandestinovirus TaxID=2831644 RepID=A0A8F8KSM6_9VIRU|nr:hypothetical protein KOM_12_90 [Clandestinovirus]